MVQSFSIFIKKHCLWLTLSIPLTSHCDNEGIQDKGKKIHFPPLSLPMESDSIVQFSWKWW